MRKLFLLLSIVLISSITFSQTYKDAWSIGFGISSPRIFGDVYSENFNFGVHAFVQKDFDETNSFRIKLDYLKMTSNAVLNAVAIGKPNGPTNKSSVLALDYLNTITPCKQLKLYFGTGISLIYFSLTDAVPPVANKSEFGEISINFIAGTRYSINKEWDLRGEFGLHQLSTDRFDGMFGPNGGLFGGTLDTYISSEISAMYYFDRGTEIKICDAPDGITRNNTTSVGVDYNKIQDMIQKAVASKEVPVVAGTSVGVDYNKIQDMIQKAVASKEVPVVSGTSVGVDYNKIQDMIQKAVASNKVTADVDYKKIDDLMSAKLDQLHRDSSNGTRALVGINFDVNNAEIKPEYYAVLAQDASILLSNASLNIEIQGFTDKDGSKKSNSILSERRAKNVKNYLVSKGVSPSRISIKALGAAHPISENKSYNRRIEFVIVK